MGMLAMASMMGTGIAMSDESPQPKELTQLERDRQARAEQDTIRRAEEKRERKRLKKLAQKGWLK